MKLYNNDKNKEKFEFFLKFTKKINGNDFPGLAFFKNPYNIFLVIFIIFKHVKVEKHIKNMCQKLSKNMLIVKFHLGMKCLHIFFSFFHPKMNFHPGENV